MPAATRCRPKPLSVVIEQCTDGVDSEIECTQKAVLSLFCHRAGILSLLIPMPLWLVMVFYVLKQKAAHVIDW